MFPKTWNEYALWKSVYFNGIKNMSKIPKMLFVLQMQEDSPFLYVVNICKQQITFREIKPLRLIPSKIWS